MKRLIKISLAALLISSFSCTKNFGDTNTNPGVITTPDINSLFTHTAEHLESYQGSEWTWENLEQLLRFTQHLTTDPYELSTNINTRYGTYYNDILPNLFAIRNETASRADKDRYRNINAVTYVVQVLHGLKVTDMNGSIPYTEAMRARTDGKYNPVYDNQKVLFDTWLKELDGALVALNGNATEQLNFGSSDFFYKNEWTNWAKLANTLKLRIAIRYENQDATIAKRIFKEVMADATGPIDNDDEAQFVYDKPDHDPIGNNIDYRSPRFGTSSIINFLKSTNDPRLKIYFSPNDLLGSFAAVLAANHKTLPAFININDPLIMYQGGPADWTTDPTVAQYYKNSFAVTATISYKLMSTINRKFFAPRYGSNTTGKMLDYMVTYAETCFYIAEFIQKGYGTSVNTKGNAEDWYKKGITSSIKTMNKIAVSAGSSTGFEASGDPEIQAYLNQSNVKLNGANDLERIYIQQYLNFYRLGNEAFTFCRRTGYPKNNSAYYKRDRWNEPIPRRYAVDEPPLGTNNENWLKAQQEQGFTPGNKELQILSSQRLWFDKMGPNFGEGI